MSEENKESRALEIIIAEKVYERLKTQILIVYAASLAVAALIGISLVWKHHTVSELSDARISEYRLLVAEKLNELHQLDLGEVAIRTRSLAECASPLPREDAEDLLTVELDRPPESAEINHLLEAASGFGVCDIGVVRHILEDAVNMARVDTVYRLLLHRPADPIGRFIYGYWLTSGVDVEAVGREIMLSPEFAKLRKLSDS